MDYEKVKEAFVVIKEVMDNYQGYDYLLPKMKVRIYWDELDDYIGYRYQVRGELIKSRKEQGLRLEFDLCQNPTMYPSNTILMEEGMIIVIEGKIGIWHEASDRYVKYYCGYIEGYEEDGLFICNEEWLRVIVSEKFLVMV